MNPTKKQARIAGLLYLLASIPAVFSWIYVNGKVFVGTAQGAVVCLSAESGQELWRATVGEPIIFQPVVAAGRVYVTSGKGTLFCVETGDAEDDGWLMWGGDPAHNGLLP